MLFEEAHNDQLKAWLTAELEPVCDADPEVLADYVLALLKHEAPEAELKKLLIEQLEDFLAGETESFVSKTFETLADKAYLPRSEVDEEWDISAAADAPEESRKRRADDDGSDDSNRLPPQQSRRLDNDGNGARSRGRDLDGSRDTTSRREPRKQMCRDYHHMGFCPRGNNCKFEHSNDMAAGLNMQQPSRGPFPMGNQMGPGGMNQMQHSGMMFPGQPYGMPPQGWIPGMPGQQQNLHNGDSSHLAHRLGGPGAPQGMDAPLSGHQGPPAHFGQQPGGRGGMSSRGRGRGSGPPGTFQSSRRSNTTLVIENVPAEHLDLIKVNEYFKTFGTITNISIDKPGSKALVSYSQPSEAKSAHESPEVIFGNRFVKVYFQRLDESGPSTVSQTAAPVPTTPLKSNFVPGKTSNVYHARPSVAAPSNAVSDERKKLLEEQKVKQGQLDAQLSEQKLLIGKFGDKSLSADDKKQTMSQLKKLGDDIAASTRAVKAAVEALQAAPKESAGSTAGANWQQEREKREREQLDRELEVHANASSPSSTTDELKKKLESLKAEAASLGLDGSGAPNDGSGFRGRGRGGYVPRGRGNFAPYGRGRGAAQANRSLRLDNRTTRIKITGLPSDADKDKVKSHFSNFGEIESMEDAEGDALTMVYKTRSSGEQALRGGTDIPNIGSVKLSWDQPPVSTGSAVTATNADAAVTASGEEDEYDEDRDSSWKR